MTSYVAMRTDSRVREFIASQLRAGLLRQGWGYEYNQDLETIRRTPRSERDEHQVAAWRGNRRLLEGAVDGLQAGDVVLLPNVPTYGRWAIARITGPYRYEVDREQGDYGHIRPVSPWLTPDGLLAEIHPHHPLIPAALRRSMTCRSRMWSLDGFADCIESVIASLDAGHSAAAGQTKDERFATLVSSMRAEAYELIDHGWGGAELEDLVVRVLERRYHVSHPGARVEHLGGPGEHGIDVRVTLPDPLGVTLKIGVQVKKHEGLEHDTRPLEQLATAHQHWGIHAGVILTTATGATDAFEARRDALSEELGIDIRLLFRDDFIDLVLERVAVESADFLSPIEGTP